MLFAEMRLRDIIPLQNVTSWGLLEDRTKTKLNYI